MTKEKEQIDHATKKFYTTHEWVKYQGGVSYNTLIKLIQKRKENGLDRAIIRVNKLYMINKKLFEEWLDKQRDDL